MSKPRELKHCFALIHKDAKKYEDWIIMGLPSPTGDDFDCVELREVTHESESELAELRKDYAELLEVKERLAIRLHSELSTLTAKVKRYEEVFNKEFFLNIITEWKFSWMNQRQNDQKDYENYHRRAFGVDANMKHDLASRLARAALNQGED